MTNNKDKSASFRYYRNYNEKHQIIAIKFTDEFEDYQVFLWDNVKHAAKDLKVDDKKLFYSQFTAQPNLNDDKYCIKLTINDIESDWEIVALDKIMFNSQLIEFVSKNANDKKVSKNWIENIEEITRCIDRKKKFSI